MNGTGSENTVVHPNSLPSDQWIRRRSEYQSIQSTGKVFRQPNLTILYSPGQSESARYGITVSRRVGNAVVRNRIKRRIREIIRHQWRNVSGQWNVVFIARPSAADASFHALESEIVGFSTWLSRRRA